MKPPRPDLGDTKRPGLFLSSHKALWPPSSRPSRGPLLPTLRPGRQPPSDWHLLGGRREARHLSCRDPETLWELRATCGNEPGPRAGPPPHPRPRAGARMTVTPAGHGVLPHGLCAPHAGDGQRGISSLRLLRALPFETVAAKAELRDPELGCTSWTAAPPRTRWHSAVTDAPGAAGATARAGPRGSVGGTFGAGEEVGPAGGRWPGSRGPAARKWAAGGQSSHRPRHTHGPRRGAEERARSVLFLKGRSHRLKGQPRP